ncbi:MAG: type II toxin-antitoxin system RelE/ParE family toxin [Terriglobia bacterium]|jgi:proteic killer suppression protein
MSRLRCPSLYDRYIFVTVKLLPSRGKLEHWDYSLPGNRLERLHRDREGQYSVRINDQWRTCFAWQEGDACDVEITDYH